ncbi:MAG: hypothetical protein ACI361_02075 [Atopobiaceae bacterium]
MSDVLPFADRQTNISAEISFEVQYLSDALPAHMICPVRLLYVPCEAAAGLWPAVRWHSLVDSACTSDVRMRVALRVIGAKPMDNILEILQALALFAGILKTILEIVEGVDRIRREHKAS